MEEIPGASRVSVTKENSVVDQAADSSLGTEIESAFPKASNELVANIGPTLTRFTEWLRAYGETSWDHQSFFAGPVGRRAKSLYYQHRYLGTLAVAPIIFCEAFLPSTRRLFHRPTPISNCGCALRDGICLSLPDVFEQV